MSGARLVGAYEVPYARHPAPAHTTEWLLGAAVVGAVREAGLTLADVDGLGVGSFTVGPDTVVDLACKLGLSPSWLMQDPLGGASGVNLLQHAVRAVEAGDARVVVLAAGDNLRAPGAFEALTDNYNAATRDLLTPVGFGGPNSVFAMLTQRHAARFGLTDADYAQIPIAQRRWASGNPNAVYRKPLTLGEYLASPVVTEPLRRLDCVPVVAGADAVVVAAGQSGVRVRAFGARFNPDHQEGDGLSTGHRSIRDDLWARAGFGPGDVDVAGVYDDYPVMVAIQLADLGFVPDDDLARFLHERIGRGMPVNTSGGQLSCGQAGAAGGLHFVVEAVQQLLGRAGARQVETARTALVSGYGMVLYRYGASANAAVLEAV